MEIDFVYLCYAIIGFDASCDKARAGEGKAKDAVCDCVRKD